MRIYRYRKMRIKVLLISVFIVLFLSTSLYFYSHRIVPTLLSSAQGYLGIEINKKIERSMSENIDMDQTRQFINIKYTSEGKVSSVMADSNYINMTRTNISQSILNELKQGSIRDVKLPLGCLFGNELTYAKGPKLKFKIIENENFKSSVDGEFIESGINQTLHRLYLKFNVDVVISIPLKELHIPIECKYLLSEIIIVGDVPDAFTDINRTFDDITESEIDDINDFGAG